MRLAHLADLHLGFRQFDRMTAAGANQREADVAQALHATIDGVLAAQPDAILVAGDVFHQVRPPNGAILRLFSEFQRLRVGLPAAPIVLIAGDHDTPRSSSGESILGLYRALGVQVVDREITAVPCAGLTVLAVPKLRARQLREYTGDRGDVLLLHGEVRDVPGADLAAEALDGWRYVALGHWHVCQQMGPRAWYAGSLEFVSTDPWSELRGEVRYGSVRRGPVGRGEAWSGMVAPGQKGWLLVELGSDEPVVTFQPIAAPRRFLDLPVLDATDMTAAAIDAALQERATAIDGAVVRQVVLNLRRETRRALDHAALRGYKGRALNYHFDSRRPTDQAPTPGARAARMGKLDEILDTFLAERPLPADVDRAALRALGQEYLTIARGTDDPYRETP